MELASYKGKGEIGSVVSRLINHIENSAITATLMQRNSHMIDGHLMIVLGFEKYFYRSSNQAMLTIIIVENEYQELLIDVLSGGTAKGVFLKFDLDASKSFINTVHQILVQLQFTRTK